MQRPHDPSLAILSGTAATSTSHEPTAPEELIAIRQTPGVELHQCGTVRPRRAEKKKISPSCSCRRWWHRTGPHRQHHWQGRLPEAYGAIVVSFLAQQGWLRQELVQTQLSAGEVLVLQGAEEAMARVGRDRPSCCWCPSTVRRAVTGKPAGGGIMLASVVAAGSISSRLKWRPWPARWPWSSPAASAPARRIRRSTVVFTRSSPAPFPWGRPCSRAAPRSPGRLAAGRPQWVEPDAHLAGALRRRGGDHAAHVRRGDHRTVRAGGGHPRPGPRPAGDVCGHGGHGRGGFLPHPHWPPRKPAGLRARGYQFTDFVRVGALTILVALVVTWPAPRSGPTNSMRRQLRPTDSERQIGGSPSDPYRWGLPQPQRRPQWRASAPTTP